MPPINASPDQENPKKNKYEIREEFRKKALQQRDDKEKKKTKPKLQKLSEEDIDEALEELGRNSPIYGAKSPSNILFQQLQETALEDKKEETTENEENNLDQKEFVMKSMTEKERQVLLETINAPQT